MNFLYSTASIFKGFGTAHLMHQSKKSEDTITQGKNYVLAAPQVLVQTNIAFSQLAEVISKIAAIHPSGIITFSLSLFTSFPARLTMVVTVVFSALHRNDQFKNFSEKYNDILKQYQPSLIPYIGLNSDVSPLKDKIFIFISTHSGNISQVVVTICAVAKYALGAEKEAISTLVIMGIGYMDRKGILPERVSVFFNDNLTNIANVSTIIFGSPLQKVIGLINLSLSSGIIMQKISCMIDNRVVNFFASHGIFYPTLESLEKKEDPSSKAKLSAKDILNFDETKPTRVDSSHVRRGVSVAGNSNAEFKTLNTLFNKIGFEGYALTRMVSKIQSDDRFIKEFLTKSEVTKKLLSDNLTPKGEKLWESALSKSKELDFETLEPIYKQIKPESKAIWEKALFEYGKIQLGLFVENISGKKQPKGDLSGIIKTREACKTVISFMEDQHKILEDQVSDEKIKRFAKLHVQNLLSTLLVEGGDYCVTGIEGAVRACMDAVLQENGGNGTVQGRLDVMAQNARNHLFGQMYGLVTDKNFNAAFEFIQASDRHTFNQLKSVYGAGLGLDLSAAQNDKAIEIAKFDSLLIPTLYPISRIPFWNTDLSVEEATEKLKTASIKLTHGVNSISEIYKNNSKSNWKLIRAVQKTIAIAPKALELFGNSLIPISLCGIIEFNNKTDFAYNEKMLITRAKEMIDQKTITISDYTDWWREYVIKVSNGDENLKDELMLEILYNPTDGFMKPTFDIKGNITGQIVNEKYLKIMLIEMGFLKHSN